MCTARGPLPRRAFDNSSGQTAIAAVRRALAAIGAPRDLAAIRTVSLDGRGLQFREAERQGRSPDSTFGSAHQERFGVDFAAGRVAFEFRTSDPTVGPRWRRVIYHDGEEIVLNFGAHTASRTPGREAAQLSYARRLPLALLREAADHPESLSYESPAVVYMPKDGGAIRLQFDPADGRLAAVESSVDFPGEGVRPVRFEYFGKIEPEPGIRLPAGHRERLGGRLLEELRYTDARLNRPSDVFEVPEDFRALVDPPGTVAAIGPGVYLVENLFSYNLLFVEFRNFVVAVEAPAPYPGLNGIPARTAAGGREISEAYRNKIRKTIPGKPLRYVVITHHHSDHAGGAAVFADAGATLLASPGDRRFLEELAPGASVETVADERFISDGTQEMRIFNVGTNPHSDEMLVVYLPGLRFLYQSDLFFPDDRSVSRSGHYPPVMQFFAAWLSGRRLAPSKIFGFHTSGFQTMEDVADVLSGASHRK
jgi:glyoxylase-like metal-dependent hydrolase (beta-lactamase superfamily II)